MRSPRFLTHPDLRLLLFGGKGGVGKTTCAVAAALDFARRFPQRSVLLLSTDPAHSLQDSFAGLRLPATLEVVEFDAQQYLVDFRRQHGKQLQAIAERGTFLESEDISRFLSLSLPGMDELFGFLDIARRAESASEGERIVVDTAPTGHTLRLLAMPELLREWVQVLDTLLAKHRYMKQLFAGRYRPDELDRFLDELSASIATADALLTDPQRCRFVPVMAAEELSVRETTALLAELDQLRLPADEVVVNMLSPSSGCASCTGQRLEQLRELRRLPAPYQGRALWGVPLRPREVQGPELHSFWDEAVLLDPRALAESTSTPPALTEPAQPGVDANLNIEHRKPGHPERSSRRAA
ncbi:MAG: ArsA family ATPase, partial [Deltaproteobacteria bacterium]|nr:ArsA family ATPase [Deltaproteobacteria bacterium]